MVTSPGDEQHTGEGAMNGAEAEARDQNMASALACDGQSKMREVVVLQGEIAMMNVKEHVKDNNDATQATTEGLRLCSDAATVSRVCDLKKQINKKKKEK